MKIRIQILSAIFVFFVISLLFNHCSENNIVKYYRHIDIEAREPVLGLYPVIEQNVEKLNCYRLSYNKNDQIIMVEYLQEGKPAIDPLHRVHKFILDYKDSLQVRTHRDLYGNPIYDRMGVYKYYRIFNEKQNTILAINYDDSDNIIKDILGTKIYFFILNENGFAKKHYHLNENSDTVANDDGTSEWRYKYDEYGNAVELSFYNNRGILMEDSTGTAIVKNYYDSHGNSTKTIKYNINGNLVGRNKHEHAMWVSKYDEKGNELESRYYTADSTLFGRIEFNEYGHIKYLMKYPIGFRFPNNGENKIAYEKTVYDDYDNIIEIGYYTEDGNLEERRDTGFALIDRKFDEFNCLMEQSYYDAQRKKVNHKIFGYAYQKLKYNEIGILIEIANFGIDNQLAEDAEANVAIYQWEYDNNWNKTKMIGLNKKREIVLEKNLAE